MVKNKKGDRRERELVNKLHSDGFAVMRAPASGAATDRELPDVLAGNTDKLYAFEAKSSSGDPIYIDEQEVIDLQHFSQSFGAQPMIAVRFDREEWAFFNPDEVYRTKGGNYRIKKQTALDTGHQYSNFIESPVG